MQYFYWSSYAYVIVWILPVWKKGDMFQLTVLTITISKQRKIVITWFLNINNVFT